MRKIATAVTAVLALALALPAVADEPVGSAKYALPTDDSGAAALEGAVEQPENWGGAALVAHDVAAIGFSPLSDGQWIHFSTGWSEKAAGANTATCTNVSLPSGALLTNITTYTNDTNAAADLNYTLFSINLSTSTGTTAFTFTTAGAPGIQRVLRAVTPNITINNNQNAYALCVFHNAIGPQLQNAGATFWYRLQVSPAPGVATFPNDVPTNHPQFRFVEALAAAGITSGCGPGLFCPDSPVTRGQMAVFLSVALGMHFPN